MTLREQAEKEATESLPCRCTEYASGRCPQHTHAKTVADVIERVAKALAERAAGNAWDAGCSYASAFEHGYGTGHPKREQAVAEAIAAAERGE